MTHDIAILPAGKCDPLCAGLCSAPSMAQPLRASLEDLIIAISEMGFYLPSVLSLR